MQLKRAIILLGFTLFLSQCRKENEIKAGLEPGRVAAVAAFRILSVSHIGEEMVKGKNSGFLTGNTQITQTDSTYADGDGLQYVLDFHTGVVCSDGILRKGKLTVDVTDSALPFFIFQISCKTADSFAISAKTGWEYVVGELKVMSSKSATELAMHLAFVQENGEILHHDTTSGTKWLKMQYAQPNHGGKIGRTLTGEWTMNYSGNQYVVVISELVNTGGCHSNWNEGALQVIPAAGDAFDIDMDPYGNEACDQVFKVTRKVKLIQDEMTFDAW